MARSKQQKTEYFLLVRCGMLPVTLNSCSLGRTLEDFLYVELYRGGTPVQVTAEFSSPI